MAQKVTITLIDDLDGENNADETVEFGIDGVSYEIDLSAANAARLRKELDAWVGSARRLRGRRRVKSTGVAKNRAAGERGQSALIREWARDNGHEVPARGRISAEIRDAYNKAVKK